MTQSCVALKEGSGPHRLLIGCLCMWLGTLVSPALSPYWQWTGPAHAQAAKKKTTTPKLSKQNALERRVTQLEEQIVDLQVVIGTLESLAKPGGAASKTKFTSGRAASGDAANLSAQVTALSSHVERLSAEVQHLQSAGARTPTNAPPVWTTPSNSNQNASEARGNDAFGATTVSRSETPDSPDAIGSLIDAQKLPPVAQPITQPAPPVGTPAPDVADDAEAKETYEAAYGELLQQDYAAAQSSFRAFLRNFPKHTLVPNALYWLGETYYVQQNYTDAAEAFDIVTAAYGSSNKAPDSQLKRGMSLANLGKRSEACSVLGSLARRYPNAPDHVKSKADSERQRAGCS